VETVQVPARLVPCLPLLRHGRARLDLEWRVVV